MFSSKALDKKACLVVLRKSGTKLCGLVQRFKITFKAFKTVSVSNITV